MEITYELPWVHVKKGTVIGLNETPVSPTGSEPLWKVLKIDEHGCAEIIPYTSGKATWMINDNPYPDGADFNGGLNLDASGSYSHFTRQATFKNQAETVNWYYYDVPYSQLHDAAIWESVLHNAPYYNYLKPMTMKSQTCYNGVPSNKDVRQLQLVRYTASGTKRSYYYQTSLATANSGTFHWRPFSISDLVSYTNHYNMNYRDYEDLFAGGLSAILTADAVSTSTDYGYQTTNESCTAKWKIEPNSSWETSAFTNGVTPILKLDLTGYKNWHIVKQ